MAWRQRLACNQVAAVTIREVSSVMSFAGQGEGKPGCRGSRPDARARRLAARAGVEDQMRDAVSPDREGRRCCTFTAIGRVSKCYHGVLCCQWMLRESQWLRR
jgi:hypothetical protein